MGDVLRLEDHQEMESVSYTESDGDLGLGTRDRKVELRRLNAKDFILITPSGDELHSRESLAEFLWCAATFVDSEERYRPDKDLIGCDY